MMVAQLCGVDFVGLEGDHALSRDCEGLMSRGMQHLEKVECKYCSRSSSILCVHLESLHTQS